MADNPGILADYIVWMDVDVLNLIWISDSWVASPKKRGGGRINAIKKCDHSLGKMNYLFSKSCD